MIENYYKILELKPDAGIYRIAKHYKNLADKYLKQSISSVNSIQKVYQICRAVEVLKNEQMRKYYDILYHIFILKTSTEISNERIQQYLSIVETSIEKGNERAETIINQPNSKLHTYITKPLFKQYIQAVIYFYVPFSYLNRLNLFFVPFLGLIYIIIGIIAFFRPIGISWGLGVFFIMMGCSILYYGFQKFIIDLIYKE